VLSLFVSLSQTDNKLNVKQAVIDKYSINNFRMKKIFLLIVMSCFTVLAALGQNVAGNCYRGFMDAGYTIGFDTFDFNRFEINTSHGYQINPYLFVGGGAGLHFMQSYKTSGSGEIALDTRDSKVSIPVFANFRGTMLKSRFTPFIDLKTGTFINNGDDLYTTASLGLRIAVNKKQAIDVMVGYTSEKLNFETFDHFTGYYSLDYTRVDRKANTDAITVKIGYEF
jgi:hypothetical protein